MAAPAFTRCALALAGAPILSVAALGQTTWYVDAGGIPPGTGTQTDPYTSIQFALDRPTTLSGDALEVAAGAYMEDLNIIKDVRIVAPAGPLATQLRRSVPPSTQLAHVRVDGTGDEAALVGFAILGGEDPSRPAIQTGVLGDLRLERCIVAGNAGLAIEFQSLMAVVNCTVAGNGAGIEADLAFAQMSIRSSIVANDALDLSGIGAFFVQHSVGFLNTAHPAVGSGINNAVADPLFWVPSILDLHLRPGSPAIDRGPGLDPDGTPRDGGALLFDAQYGPVHVYCEGKTNSQGCLPAIASSGSPSATNPAPFRVTASLIVPNRRGLLLYAGSADDLPFQGGTLCISQPFRRTVGQLSGGGPAPCTGSFAIDFNQRIQSGLDPSLVPGALVYAQYWFRDPNDPTGFQSGMTDALLIGIAP